jgi:predicted TIM-barrel fold metal-dependent hydrolase
MDPVFNAIEKSGRTLVAHLGEPRNCWLPLDAMTTDSDRRYFAGHPEYHGLLHPEVPDYARQIAARDKMLERHPGLRVVGCHLASLEYDVDELAKRLDRYPNLAVDLAARMVHLQIQPREKVRAFILKYQDRILYGTDLEFGRETGAADADPAPLLARLAATYESDAAWLATDRDVAVESARAGFTSRGLALPGPVLRKLYVDNARRWYPGL